MKKKVVALLLLSCLAISTAACGTKDETTESETVVENTVNGNELTGDSVDWQSIEYEEATVPEEDIDARIDEMISNYQYITETDRTTIQDNDYITLDYTMECDGEVVYEETNVSYNLSADDGMFADSKDEFIGKEIGQEITFDITYADDAVAYAGKTVTFNVVVNQIYDLSNYEKDDTLAEACGYSSYDELREAIKNELSSSTESQTQANAVEAYAEYYNITASEEDIQAAIDSYSDIADSLSAEDLRSYAEEVALENAVADDIIAREGLTLTESIKGEISEKLYDTYGLTIEDILTDDNPDAETELLREYAIDQLMDSTK